MAFLNIFRSLAIITIVFNHSMYPAGWKAEGLFRMFLHNLVAGSTILFVFISGYLFHQLSFERFQYVSYLKSKLSTLLPAYLALSIIPIASRLTLVEKETDSLIFTLQTGSWFEHFQVIAAYLLTGFHVTGYWFIPAIILLYATAPFYVYFVKKETKFQLLVLFLLFTISTLIHRPHQNINVLQSYLYFLPVYLTGILCSVHSEFVKKALKGRHGWGFLIFLFLTILQPLVYNNCGNIQKSALVWQGFDIIFFQKLVLAVVLIDFLRDYFDRSIWFFNLTATASFAIYLLHPYVVAVLNVITRKSHLLHQAPWALHAFQGDVLLPPLYTSLILFFTLLMGVVIKLATRNLSKHLIGW